MSKLLRVGCLIHLPNDDLMATRNVILYQASRNICLYLLASCLPTRVLRYIFSMIPLTSSFLRSRVEPSSQITVQAKGKTVVITYQIIPFPLPKKPISALNVIERSCEVLIAAGCSVIALPAPEASQLNHDCARSYRLHSKGIRFTNGSTCREAMRFKGSYSDTGFREGCSPTAMSPQLVEAVVTVIGSDDSCKNPLISKELISLYFTELR